jgi:plastocyanin
MRVGMRGGACIGAAGLLLLCPVAAEARTKTVQIGLPKASQNTFNRAGTDVNDFFPHGVTIHVGDRVRFGATGEFHTVDIPRKGGKPLPLTATTGKTISGVNDAAGNPFWFNGQPQVGFNPALAKGVYGKKLIYTGKRIESGLPLANNPKPFTVKFTKAGSYTYYCDVHPGMKGTVRVVRLGRRIPSANADRKALKAQLKRDFAIGKTLAKTTPPAGTVDVGAAGAHGVEFYGMFPNNLSVKVGTALTFRMGPGSTEIHTASFGPDDPEAQPPGYLGTIAASFQGSPVFDPRGIYPSEPGTTAALTPTFHGNGFWNTGLMDTSARTAFPTSGKVTFAAPGTYNYYCLIHPFMHGIVTVQ